MNKQERSDYVHTLMRHHLRDRHRLVNKELDFPQGALLYEMGDSVCVWFERERAGNRIFVEMMFLYTFVKGIVPHDRLLRTEVNEWWDHDAFIDYLVSTVME